MPYPHQFIKLTFKERVDLRLKSEELYKQGKKRECKRLQAIYFSDKGLTYKQLCKTVGASYRSIKGWISTYRKRGLDGLLNPVRKFKG